MKIVYYNEIPVIKLDKTYEGKETSRKEDAHRRAKRIFFLTATFLGSVFHLVYFMPGKKEKKRKEGDMGGLSGEPGPLKREQP